MSGADSDSDLQALISGDFDEQILERLRRADKEAIRTVLGERLPPAQVEGILRRLEALLRRAQL
jgi:hypothetical protein